MVRRLCFLIVLVSNAAWATSTLVINAKVITVDGDHPTAQAFAFENGRFTAVGTNKQILKIRTPSTIVIDLEGKRVTPGFNDEHLRATLSLPRTTKIGRAHV